LSIVQKKLFSRNRKVTNMLYMKTSRFNLINRVGIYVSQMTRNMLFVVLSSFITYRPVCNSNTTVPLENQELVTLPEHLSSPPVFRGVVVVLSNHYCSMWCFVDHCLSLCTFSFGHCTVCPSIYGFWLPLWYLQIFLTCSIY
jgi:hypothetical protein